MYGLANGICSARLLGAKRLAILMYHRVLVQKDPLRADMVSAEEFDQQMRWISTYFNVLPMWEAVSLMRQGRLPRRAVAITFDDGYKDNLTLAAPILEKYRLTASFYIATNYLHENPKWDYLIEAIRETPRQSIELLGKEYPLNTLGEKARFSEEAPRVIKAFEEEKADRYLEELIDELGRVPLQNLMMEPEDLNALVQRGMEVGGHGVKHSILSSVSDEDAREEIVAGKRKLESIVDAPVTGFAYPNGLFPVDFDHRHIDLVKEAGFDYALSTNIGTSSGMEEMFRLRRYTPWRRGKTGFLAEMAVNYWR